MRFLARLLLWLLLLAAISAGGYWWFVLRPATNAQVAQAARPPFSIPVVVTAVETRDVPIYLDGLGTVQASASVTIKPQVDGNLIEVRFSEGQEVQVGDVLARIDPRSLQAALDQAMAKKAQDEANLANAKLDAARYAKLAVSAYTPAQQADTARATVAQLTAVVAGDQAQIDNARTQLGYTTITAPINGRVGIRLVDAGNIVRASDPAGLVVITTLRPINVVFTLPQQALADVAGAMRAGTVTVLALPQNNTATENRAVLDRGTLTVLDNQVDPATGTIKLKASFPNANLTLWPGAFVTVRLQVRLWQEAIVVPPVAVQRGPRGTYVYIAKDDATAERREVTVGHEDLQAMVISEGLQAGEKVVVDGASRLADKSKIFVVAPAGAPASAAPPAGVRRRPTPPKT